jgi:hypothetical protein
MTEAVVDFGDKIRWPSGTIYRGNKGEMERRAVILIGIGEGSKW